MGTQWEQQRSKTPPSPKRKENLGPLGACCLTSLAARIVFGLTVFFAIFGLV